MSTRSFRLENLSQWFAVALACMDLDRNRSQVSNIPVIVQFVDKLVRSANVPCGNVDLLFVQHRMIIDPQRSPWIDAPAFRRDDEPRKVPRLNVLNPLVEQVRTVQLTGRNHRLELVRRVLFL